MANEATISSSLRFKKSGRQAERNENHKADVAGTLYDSGVMDVGTGDEQLLLKADFGTPGVAWLKNLNDTNFIEIGHWNSGSPFYLLKLLPGESYAMRFTVSKTNIAVKADTGSCELEFLIVEE